MISYADGELGLWSRVLSPLLGAPLVFGCLDEEDGSGEPSVARLVRDYGLPDPGPVQGTYGIIGHPVAHSLSPRLHNASYRATQFPALFLPFSVTNFGPFWEEIVMVGALDRLGLPLLGLTVTSPLKERSVEAATVVSPSAQRAGSANVMYRRE